MKIIALAGVLICLASRSSAQTVQVADADYTIDNSKKVQKITLKIRVDEVLSQPADKPLTDLLTMEISPDPGMVIVTANAISKRKGNFVVFVPDDEFTFYGLKVKVGVVEDTGMSRTVLKALQILESTNLVMDLDGAKSRVTGVNPDGTVNVVLDAAKIGASEKTELKGWIMPSSEKGIFLLYRKSENWPSYSGDLVGRMEVRVKNPNDFGVKVGLRSEGKGKDFTARANDTQSVKVPNGRYEIYFQYSTDPDGLYQGDSFTLNDNGVEIQIVKVVNGNYGIRKVK